jgi:lipid A ethanolaminephosphotransferase
VKRSGIDVLWLDNNSGCKGVCDRVSVEIFDRNHHAGTCQDGECFDEVLAQDLKQHIADLRRDTLIVLHQKGSHGPAYYRRYPPAFERFTPTCKSIRLSDCTSQALHNAYDNTIVYVDFVVTQVIEALKQRGDRLDSAALYVSDHGESLGESGLYLHGAPSMMAPDVQLQIPLYAWFSEGYRKRSGLNTACVRQSAGAAYSHDNLFHTTLSLLDVETSAYRRPLDMFAGCRAAANRSGNIRALYVTRA